MQYRRMVVLANSIKKGGRCVAGRMTNAAVGLNTWLRPISDVNEGTLMPDHLRVEDHRTIAPLDIMEVPVLRHAADMCHPEDWLLAQEAWRRVGRLDLGELQNLEEFPADLWLEDRRHTDRISCGFHKRRQHFQSLYLVRPEQFRLRLWCEDNADKGYKQKKTRAVFRYERAEYALSLTDPLFTQRHPVVHPDVGHPPVEVPVPNSDRCLICVSLTPTFNDYHYKVVATILESQ